MKTHRILIREVEVNGLYQLSAISLIGDASSISIPALTTIQSEVSSSSTNSLMEFDRWHQRLGHISATLINQVLYFL